MLKQNAWNSLNGYYWKSAVVVALAICSTLLGLAAITTMLHASFASGMMQPYSVVGQTPDPDEIRDMFVPIIIRVIYWVICLALSFLLLTFYTHPLEVGVCSFFRKARTGDAKIGEMFYAFHDARYRKILKSMLFRLPNTLVVIFSVSFSLLGVIYIPIIIVVMMGLYPYVLVPFLLSENAQFPLCCVTEISKRTMEGEKWKFFQLQLSFLGWFLLGVVTLGVGFIFSIPYYQATKAEFYACMRAKMIAQGITTEEELTGVPAY